VAVGVDVVVAMRRKRVVAGVIVVVVIVVVMAVTVRLQQWLKSRGSREVFEPRVILRPA
jgi:hypothetical protein